MSVKLGGKLTVVVLSLLLLVGCVSNKNPYGQMNERQIFTSGQTALRSHDFATAVAAFEAQEAKYPYGSYAHQEALNIIYAYYRNGDYSSAQAVAERYIQLHPGGQYVNYAYYMSAMSLFASTRSFLENHFPIDPAFRDTTAINEVFKKFALVLRNYPQSPYANDAHLHMIYIRNQIARDFFNVAKYYYSRHAYVAALERVRSVVFKFQGAPTVPDALVIMYQCYKKLGLTKDAKATLSVLQMNYPQRFRRIKV